MKNAKPRANSNANANATLPNSMINPNLHHPPAIASNNY
jgi:hypothetical protein